MHFADRPSQTIGRLRDRDQVHVIGHQTVGPDLNVLGPEELSHQLDVAAVILVTKLLLATVPPLSNMVRQAGSNDARLDEPWQQTADPMRLGQEMSMAFPELVQEMSMASPELLASPELRVQEMSMASPELVPGTRRGHDLGQQTSHAVADEDHVVKGGVRAIGVKPAPRPHKSCLSRWAE